MNLKRHRGVGLSFRQNAAKPGLQRGHDILLEPWVAPHPDAAPPGWVRQWKKLPAECIEGAYDFRERLTFCAGKVVLLRIRPDQQGQAILRQKRHDAIMP
jgi:hypothetical protein